MPIKYNVVARKNLLKKDESEKFYAIAKADGEVNFKTISKEIAEISTVSDTDVLAVLNDLTKILVKHLSDGKIVRLGDFGSFRITISSNGAEKLDKFNSSLIRNNKIQFLAGADLKNMQKVLKYEKYKK